MSVKTSHFSNSFAIILLSKFIFINRGNIDHLKSLFSKQIISIIIEAVDKSIRGPT